MLGMVRCMLSVACCMLHVACRMFACCHRSNQFPHARTRRRICRYGRGRCSGRAKSLCHIARAHCFGHSTTTLLVAAAAAHPSLCSSVGLQLAQIEAAGTEKALLAVLTVEHPDASYIELLRFFKVRRSVADGHSQRAWCICACCALPAHICSQLPHVTVT